MPDYMFLLESRLLPEQRAALLRVQELSAAMGFNVYLTGGTVRDLITGASLRDLDFTVEGNPSKIARELEKGGAKVLAEDEKLRHVEILFSGDCEGSIAAARDDHYVRPGTRPEIRWSTIMEDLRRRDFSLNAIAISLNPASRGLLLDPTNGLSDVERAEVRALIIHSFTNQPVRLLRVLRFAARMGFKLEQRTQEWFDLAIERELHKAISSEDAGGELRAAAREESGTGGTISIALRVHPAPNAYFPGVAMGSGGFVSGYTVPALRATATGTLCVDNQCEKLSDAQSYHDHNWGVWRGVTWDWGAARAGEYTFLYGRVYPGDSTASIPPVLVYLVDSLGFRAVFRPKMISYEDGRTVKTVSGELRVPARASFEDARGDDTLRVDITVEDAIATDARPRPKASDGKGGAEGLRGDPLGSEKSRPYFIQMKGVARVSGRLDGVPLSGTGTGLFETYR